MNENEIGRIEKFGNVIRRGTTVQQPIEGISEDTIKRIKAEVEFDVLRKVVKSYHDRRAEQYDTELRMLQYHLDIIKEQGLSQRTIRETQQNLYKSISTLTRSIKNASIRLCEQETDGGRGGKKKKGRSRKKKNVVTRKRSG